MESEGWATVPNGKLIIGLSRFKSTRGPHDWVEQLQRAWYVESFMPQGECVDIDWWKIWNDTTATRVCPDNFGLQALYKAHGENSIYFLTRARYYL